MARKIAYVLLLTLVLTSSTRAFADEEYCSVAFEVDGNGLIGLLQFDAVVPFPDVKFDKVQGSPNCTVLVDAVPGLQLGNGQNAGLLSASLFNLSGFSAPTPLFECVVHGPWAVSNLDIGIEVTTAAGPSTMPISPLPSVYVSSVTCDSTIEVGTTTTTTTTTTLVPRVPVCGDGIVDDVDEDGDGYADEQCDNGSAEYRNGEACRDDCTLVPCGDADGSGTVGASDALHTLQSAVGMASCTPCVCDVDGSGGNSASDALKVLSNAVGGPQALTCPVCE